MNQEKPLGIPKDVTFTITLTGEDAKKWRAWIMSDSYERAQAIRNADIEACTNSLAHVVDYANREYGSAATVFAQFLASLYNGSRVKADISGIRSLDEAHFEHLMNVLRLCFMGGMEPHQYIRNGAAIFETIIERHKLEKRRKA